MKLTRNRTGETRQGNTARPTSTLDSAMFAQVLQASTRQANGSNSSSEDAIRATIQEYLKENKVGHEIVLLSAEQPIKPTISLDLFNYQVHRLTKSIIRIQYVVGNKSFVASLILAGGGQALTEYYVNGQYADRRESPVQATADMVFDARAKALVTNNFAATAMVEADDAADSYYPFMVLPANVTGDDKHVIYNFVDNMFDALDYQVRDVLTTEDKIEPTLQDYLVHTIPRLSVDFTPDHSSVNAAGEPIRSDARAELKYEMRDPRDDNEGGRRRNSRRKLSMNNQMSEAASISAYTNLNYFREGIGEYADKFFLPTVVLTSMDTGSRIPTIADLMVASTLSVQFVKDTNWVRTLEPAKLQQVGKDINSIISDLPPQFDENGDVFTDIDLNSQMDDFYSFIEAVTEDSPIVCLVVPRGGATSWGYQPLLYSAVDEGINDLLIDELNKITGDKFDKVLADEGIENIFIFEEHVDVIHLGNYIENDGQAHDLAEIDYLTVATYTDGSATSEEIRGNWDDTFLSENEGGKDIGSRLNDRLNIMAQTQGGMSNINVTGYADVLMFNPTALWAMNKAFELCGFRPKSEDQVRIRASQRGNRHLQNTLETNGARYDYRNQRTASRNQRRGGGRSRARVQVIR